MKKSGLLFFFSLLILSSCGSLLDISGRGSKTTCFYFDCSSLKIKYECDDKGIFQVKAYESFDKGKTFNKVLLSRELPDFPSEWLLPLDRDSIKNKYLVIELHLTDTHFRETYYIDVRPGDLPANKIRYARYFSH